MMDGEKLFNDRFKDHVKQSVRYLQYIFNGHIAIALIFLVAAGAVFYQSFLNALPDYFPVAAVISIILSLVVLYNPMQFMLKKADIVFLLPAQEQLTGYFIRGLLYSLMVQSYLSILVIGVLAPLFHIREHAVSFTALISLFVITKLIQFTVDWFILRIRHTEVQRYQRFLRFFVQVAIFYSVLSGITLAIIFSALLFGILIISLLSYSLKHVLALDLLIENDQRRKEVFYRIASLFTDVPELATTVKKRKFMVRLFTQHFPIRQTHTYRYLYQLTFMRSKDYLGIFVRLSFIGGLALYYTTIAWLAVVLSLLFIYLIGIQLLSLWYHHRTLIWLDLYPVSGELQRQALASLILRLLSITASIYLVVTMVQLSSWSGLIVGISSYVFVFLFVNMYLPRKLILNNT